MNLSTPAPTHSVALATLDTFLKANPQLESSILLIALALETAYRANPSDQAIAMLAISVMERLIAKESEAHRNFEMLLKRSLTTLKSAQQPDQAAELRNIYRHSRLANNRSELHI